MKQDFKDGKNPNKKKKKKVPFNKASKFPNLDQDGKGANDKKWFNNVPGVLNSITLPQFLIRKGLVNINGDTYGIGVPTICALRTILTMGSNEQGALTNSVKRLYSNLRRANTGSVVYSETDLYHYLYNLSNAIAVDRYIRRAYGVLSMWDGLDTTKPISYFKAMGLDFDSFRDNRANLRMVLNNNSERIHTLMAGKCALFERRAWMFDHIFKDGQTNKAQEYIFVPDTRIYYWDWTTSQYMYESFGLFASTVGRPYANIISSYNNLMKNILADNKVALISADIIKAYGLNQSDSYFSIIPENYTAPSVYNEEVLNEIQNAKLCGTVNYAVSDVGGVLTETMDINTSGSYGATDPSYANYINNNVINYYTNKVDILDYAVATRLSPRMEFNPNNSYTDITSFGTEVIMWIDFVVPSSANVASMGTGLDAYGLTSFSFVPFSIDIAGPFNRQNLLFALWSYFDWAPMFYPCAHSYYASDGTLTPNFAYNFPLFDFDNYAILDTTAQLSNIHSACTLSLLYWPDVIKDTRIVEIK